ncbi:MAG: sensor histidine kinase [Planctomycetes bacterium]|nr:sensor histidine kinase [Planctomycetota bacterium]
MQGQGQTIRRGAGLRVLLLAGLFVAVVVPFALFAWLGNRELMRATKDNLGRHLLVSEARSTARRIADRLAQARELAVTFTSAPVLRRRFEDTNEARAAFERFHSRVSDLVGSVLLVTSRAGAEPRVLFPDVSGDVRARSRKVLEAWVNASSDGTPVLVAPLPDPLDVSGSLSAPRDPTSWVLPLILPMRDDTQVSLGVCVFLLPLEAVQEEIEQTRRSLVEGANIASATLWVADRSTGRFLLHTDRALIGGPCERIDLIGFEDAGTNAFAMAALNRPGLPSWRVGISVSALELFQSVDTLSRFFLGLVVLVLAATLGIGAWISLRATRSLSRLESTTRTLGAGDLAARAEVAGPREVRALAEEFNRMAERLAAEQERLKHAERDRAWTKMARQVAHEIKNPLQPVRLHAELIARAASGGSLDEVQRDRVKASADVILRQVDALRRIVADFSEYAQAALPMKERIRFRAATPLAELVALYSVGGADGVSVVVHDESGHAELEGSPLRLQQVLVNLVKNAIEASEGRAEAPVEVFATVDADRWICEIRDRGHGLPEGDAERPFEPAFSTKPGGTGLGLAICRRNIDAMGGEIELLPREGGGAIARVTLAIAA